MKKVFKIAALGTTILALGSTAFSAPLELNIFGASAQYKFWNSYATTFLQAPSTGTITGGMGCTSIAFTGSYDANNGVTVGNGCTANGGDQVILRYTSNKSIEGPRAVVNLQPTADVDTCPAVGGVYKNRRMASWTGGSTTVLECVDVHIGASDVSSEAFTQSSSGKEKGYLQTG